MAYDKTNWVNGQPPAIDATHLNKIEQGIYDLSVSLDEDVLSLDQTTPQTVINGIPLLDKTFADFTDIKEFVNKDYVDTAVTSLGARYYMIDTSSGISDYKLTQLSPPSGSEQSVTKTGLADDDYIAGWISLDTSMSKLIKGVYNWHIYAEKTGGTQTLRLYWQLVERKSDTTETVIATSAVSNEISTSKGSYIIPLTLSEDYTLADGSYVVGKLYADVSDGGSAPDVTIYYDGSSKSHWEIPTNLEILSDQFLEKDAFDDNEIKWASENGKALGLTGNNLIVAHRLAEQTVVDDGYYNAFGNIAVYGDSNLVVVYRKGTSHASDKGYIVMRTSSDFGRTWSDESTIYTDETYDARDPCISVLSDGTWIVSFMLYDYSSHIHPVDSIRVIKSTDNGATWGSAITVDSSFTEMCGVSAPVVELSNGDLILPIYGRNTGDSSSYLTVHSIKSTDGGDTWGSEVTIANGETDSKYYGEGNIVLLSNGDLICMIREDNAKEIYMSTSTDNGATWSSPVKKFDGYGAPRTIQLSNGWLVCLYRQNTTTEVAVRISEDNGSTWSNDQYELVIDTFYHSGMMVYGGMAEIRDGLVATVYFIETSSSTAEGYFKYMSVSGVTDPLGILHGKGLAVNYGDIEVYDGGIFKRKYNGDPLVVFQSSGDNGYLSLYDASNNLNVKIDAANSGRIGIGTDTPSYPLHIISDLATSNDMFIKMEDGTTGGYITFGESSSSTNIFVPQFKFHSTGVNGFGAKFIGSIAVAKDVLSTTGATIVLQGQREDNTALTAANVFAIRNYATSLVTVTHDGKVGIGDTTPNSLLQINGSLAVKRKATAADYTTAGETIVGVTDTTAARTITLATADCVAGRLITIKDESGGAGTNNITIATEGSETIDGASTATISTNYGCIRLYSNGSNWFII